MKSKHSCKCFTWFRRSYKVEERQTTETDREAFNNPPPDLSSVRVSPSVKFVSPLLSPRRSQGLPLKSTIYTRNSIKVKPVGNKENSSDDMVNLDSPIVTSKLKSVFSGLNFKPSAGSKLPVLLPHIRNKPKLKVFN